MVEHVHAVLVRLSCLQQFTFRWYLVMKRMIHILHVEGIVLVCHYPWGILGSWWRVPFSRDEVINAVIERDIQRTKTGTRWCKRFIVHTYFTLEKLPSGIALLNSNLCSKYGGWSMRVLSSTVKLLSLGWLQTCYLNHIKNMLFPFPVTAIIVTVYLGSVKYKAVMYS
jgi:hypothetical protein